MSSKAKKPTDTSDKTGRKTPDHKTADWRTLQADIARKGFQTLNKAVVPLVKAGVGSPLPYIGGGIVMLETKGRKSGLPRQVPLLGFRIGDKVIVSTVRSGSQWAKNLDANDSARVWLNGKAHEATGEVEGGPLTVATLKLN